MKQNQNIKKQNELDHENENSIQPPFKNYILGIENNKQVKYETGVEKQNIARGMNKSRTFGRILNNNCDNQFPNQMQNVYSQSQPLHKPFKDEFEINSNKNRQSLIDNKENVYNNPLQDIKRENNTLFQNKIQYEYQQRHQNKIVMMVNEFDKTNKQDAIESKNHSSMEAMDISQNMIKSGDHLLSSSSHHQDTINAFKKVQEDNSLFLNEYLEKKSNPFDRQFIKDPVQIAELSSQIFEYLYIHQEKYVCKGIVDLSQMHKQLTEAMRCLLIDWLTEVAIRYNLKEETLFLCYQLLDIYCRLCYQDNIQIERESYQKAGVACLFIASKIEEIYPPETTQFVAICDGAYKLKELIEQELDVCLKMQFDFSFPTPYTFLMRFAKVLGFKQLQFQQGLFVLYICQMNYELSPVYNKPSLLASSACFIVENITETQWDQKIQPLQQIIQFHSSMECMCLIKAIHKMVELYNNPKFPYHAIRQKFSLETFENVSIIFCQNSVENTRNNN